MNTRIINKKIINKKYEKKKKYFCVPYYNNHELWEQYGFTSSEVGKIIKLGLYITYNNELKFWNNVNITSRNINKILDVSESTVYKTLNSFLNNNVFYFDTYPNYKTKRLLKNKNNDFWIYNCLKLNKSLIFKGSLPITDKGGYFMVYEEELKNLYLQNISYVNFGNLFRLIPFMDKETNSISLDAIPEILNIHPHNKRAVVNSFIDCDGFYYKYNNFYISKKLICKK